MIALSLDDKRRLVAEYIGQDKPEPKGFFRGDAEFAEKILMKCFGLEPRLIGFDLTLCPPHLCLCPRYRKSRVRENILPILFFQTDRSLIQLA